MTTRDSDIAIVGMAGLYPGADDIDLLWSNILSKTDAVTEAPDGWIGDGDIFDPETDDLLKIYTRKGGFLGDLSRFDAREFGTMPLSVTGAQPDQFLALKLARDALIDAGCVPGKFDGSSTGVILGHAIHAHRANTNGMQQVWFHAQTRNLLETLFPGLPDERIRSAVELLQAKLPKIAPEAVPGLVPNVLTGRIANRLDLMGPNYIIDAACASSIISVDLAIGELRAGNADMMLAGGVNTTTSPLVFSVFCSVGALSRNGRIRPFDSEANGTALGEGAGIVVLKRLEDALAADDRIYAVIKGIGQSSDGTSSGLMAPRLEGEVLAIERAYRSTGLDPASIGLIEAHGTGIPLGDQTEIDALRTVFGGRASAVPTVPMGSVKSMIGHCIPASGSAAIIKTAFALQNRIIPPTLCDEVNDAIGLQDTPFFVATEARPWVSSADAPRRAAINAFGFGGINAHMILEEPPIGRHPDPTAAFSLPVPASLSAEQVFVFAGADRAELVRAVGDFADTLGADADLAALARQSWAAAAEISGPQRLSVVAKDAGELEKKIGTALKKLQDPETRSLQTRNGIYFEAEPLGGKVAFLFPGELAQYPGMMEDAAMAFPVVRDWFDFISGLTEARRDVRLQDVTFPPPNCVDEAGRKLLSDLMHRVDYGSEMVFAADQAVFSLLSSLGIRADAMLGHSTGENAALVASGRLKLDRQGVGRMISQMNDIFSQVEQSGAVPTGVLLTVAALERPKLTALLNGQQGIHFTMDNCPNQAILFGDQAGIDRLQDRAVAEGAVCTRLPISWGYHTGFVAPMADAFGALFEGVELAASDVVLYSCATAAPFPEERADFRDTAVSQYVSSVRFSDAVNRLYEDGYRVFIECGPNSILTSFVRDILGDRRHLADSADNRRRGMVSQLRHLIARLFAAGVSCDASALLAPEQAPDRSRRQDLRDKQRNAPKLVSELPFVRLDEAEGAELRNLIFDGRPAGPAAAPERTVSPHTPASPQQSAHSPGAPGPAGGGATISSHLDLMRDFLARQGRVARQAIAAPAVAGRAAVPLQRPGAIQVLDLSPEFDVPFAFRAYLMRGNPSFASVLSHLGDAERLEAEAVANGRNATRAWPEWSLSRLATKRAAADVIGAETGVRPQDGNLEVLKHAGGAPYLRLDQAGCPAPAISISHALASGLGAAAGGNYRLGIDYDLPSRLRNPAEFLDTVISDSERRALPLAADGHTAAIVWSLKEAAGKALGVGIQGRPRDFSVVELDPARASAEILHGSHRVSAQFRQIGEGVCAIAYLSTS